MDAARARETADARRTPVGQRFQPVPQIFPGVSALMRPGGLNLQSKMFFNQLDRLEALSCWVAFAALTPATSRQLHHAHRSAESHVPGNDTSASCDRIRANEATWRAGRGRELCLRWH